MPNYITLPIETNPNVLLQRVYDYLAAHIPGWTPAEGNLDVWLAEAMSTETAELTDVASRVPDSIFRYFGASLMGLPPIDATSATTTTTWTMRDTAGYTIPAGTQVGIRNADTELVPFVTVNAVTVAPGASTTSAGAIQIIASTPGSSGSGLGGASQPVELIDILDYVTAVTMVQATSGGVDAETDGEYLNRLVGQLQLLTLTPILPQDFAELAKTISPVYRAVALDGYNPADDSFSNEKMVAIACVDINGNALSSPQKSAVDAYLQSLREVNFVVNVFDPTYTTIDVTTQVHVLPGYTPTSVIASVTSALQSFLSPATWGQPIGNPGDAPSDPTAWLNATVVRKFETSQAINNASGVDYIISMTQRVAAGTMAEADVTLAGRVSLPLAGTITVTTG